MEVDARSEPWKRGLVEVKLEEREKKRIARKAPAKGESADDDTHDASNGTFRQSLTGVFESPAFKMGRKI